MFNHAVEFIASPTGQIVVVVATFALTIMAFIADKVRSDIVALCSLALLLVTNVLTPGRGFGGIFQFSRSHDDWPIYRGRSCVPKPVWPKSFRAVC